MVTSEQIIRRELNMDVVNTEVPYVENDRVSYTKTDRKENIPPVRMQLIWTGGGYYTKYVWKGEVLYHRSSRKEGVLYREKPLSKDGVHVIDMERYEHKHELESLVKNQLLDDFRQAGIPVTKAMENWADGGRGYKWQFFPCLKTDQIIALNRGDWHGCVWTSEHQTIVTVHPRLTEILSN
jgi:hypothetical protein